MSARFLHREQWSRSARIAAAILGLAVAIPLAAAAVSTTNSYHVHNLVSDGTVPADHTDPNLVNGWGLATGGGGPWWVASADRELSTLYDVGGNPLPFTIQVQGAPTGVAFNSGESFVISDQGASGPAQVLFATEDGKISGWNPQVPGPFASNRAIVAIDRSQAHVNYKGLAIAGSTLYAADFHNGAIVVWDGAFRRIVTTGAFIDPTLPRGFAPFNVQSLNGRIFVAFAKQDADAEDEVTGPGLGFVSVFDTAGRFLARVASGGVLNAPWAMVVAPAGFGRFSGNLLVGNFGDGHINAFDLQSFASRGRLESADHRPLVIDGLWGLAFGQGGNSGSTTSLFFAAGPNDEAHGLFGVITHDD